MRSRKPRRIRPLAPALPIIALLLLELARALAGGGTIQVGNINAFNVRVTR